MTPPDGKHLSSYAKQTTGKQVKLIIYVFVAGVIIRVVPDTDLAGYPASNFAGYRISG